MILCLSNIPQNHFLRNCKMLTSYYSQWLYAMKNVQIADGEVTQELFHLTGFLALIY